MNQTLLYQNLINIKKLAIRNNLEAISGDLDCFIEKCYRYYSKTYHTELEKAYELPIERVVQIYMEDDMVDTPKEELQEMLSGFKKEDIIFEMPVEAGTADAAVDDEAWIAQMNAGLKKKEEEKDQKKMIEDTHKAIEELTKSLTKIKPDKE